MRPTIVVCTGGDQLARFEAEGRELRGFHSLRSPINIFMRPRGSETVRVRSTFAICILTRR